MIARSSRFTSIKFHSLKGVFSSLLARLRQQPKDYGIKPARIRMESEWKYEAKGFTLIELMIAIVLIAVLSSILIFGYNNLQIRARDAARRSYIDKVASALEINRTPGGYKALQVSQFPKFQEKDPGGNVYCITDKEVPEPNFTIAWEGTCPADFGIIAPGEPPGTFQTWKACTFLENPSSGKPHVYCALSSQ